MIAVAGIRMPMSKEDMKRVVKDAIKEWLDEQFTRFGKWSMAAIGSAALAGLTYFILKMNGYHK